ncbi:TGS domain-containing protein [Crocosphaera sp.]|uniref:TGS domain-containing protein n=1 Tax=Crocosphaera sp. TaxID=2729996 RepID=UPI002605385B|nr:TGS domain-containing protein [Crocosphaera sp.]MDJ0583012.1 TGS domain-containing protein [Crocosphaera sp.]
MDNPKNQRSEIDECLHIILDGIDVEVLRLEQTETSIRYCLRTFDVWMKQKKIPKKDYFETLKDKLHIHQDVEIDRLMRETNSLRPYPDSLQFDDVFNLILAIHINADFLVTKKKDNLIKFINSCNYHGFQNISLEIHDLISLAHWLSEEDFINAATPTVKVITPQGAIKILPEGSTPVDFAYKIHTEVGHSCKKAIVNGNEVPLDYQLQNWDRINIIKNNKSNSPKLEWTYFVKTLTAKTKIQQYHRDKNIKRGEKIIKREFGNRYIMTGQFYQSIAEQLRCKNIQQLLEKLGKGEIYIEQVKTIYQHQIDYLDAKVCLEEIIIEEGQPEILGIDCQTFKVADCCYPFPEDTNDIIGVLNTKKGIDYLTIHDHNCSNLTKISQDKQFVIQWNCSSCTVSLKMLLKDREDMLYNVLNCLITEEIIYDLRSFKTLSSKEPTQQKTASCIINVLISSKIQLEHIINTLKILTDVLQIQIQEITPSRANYDR